MHEWCRILLRGNGGRKKKNIVSFPETSSRRRSIFMRWRKMHFIFREHILFYFGDFQVFFFLASGSVWMSNRQSNGFILTQLNLFFFLLPRKYKKKKKKKQLTKNDKEQLPNYSGIPVFMNLCLHYEDVPLLCMTTPCNWNKWHLHFLWVVARCRFLFIEPVSLLK